MTFKLVGNTIHFEGYIVGELYESPVVPATIRAQVEHELLLKDGRDYNKGYRDGVADTKAGCCDDE